jgi:Kinesin motor domain
MNRSSSSEALRDTPSQQPKLCLSQSLLTTAGSVPIEVAASGDKQAETAACEPASEEGDTGEEVEEVVLFQSVRVIVDFDSCKILLDLLLRYSALLVHRSALINRYLLRRVYRDYLHDVLEILLALVVAFFLPFFEENCEDEGALDTVFEETSQPLAEIHEENGSVDEVEQPLVWVSPTRREKSTTKASPLTRRGGRRPFPSHQPIPQRPLSTISEHVLSNSPRSSPETTLASCDSASIAVVSVQDDTSSSGDPKATLAAYDSTASVAVSVQDCTPSCGDKSDRDIAATTCLPLSHQPKGKTQSWPKHKHPSSENLVPPKSKSDRVLSSFRSKSCDHPSSNRVIKPNRVCVVTASARQVPIHIRRSPSNNKPTRVSLPNQSAISPFRGGKTPRVQISTMDSPTAMTASSAATPPRRNGGGTLLATESNNALSIGASPSVGSNGGNSSVMVSLRIRPLLASEGGEERCIQVLRRSRATASNASVQIGGPSGPTFAFDHVLDSHATQRAVYQSSVVPLVESCLEGYNATIVSFLPGLCVLALFCSQ